MKQLVYTLFGILTLSTILSCNSQKKEEPITDEFNVLDTLMMNSQKTFEMSGEMQKKTDSAVTTKVEHTVNKIAKMEGEIKQLKQENNELKEKLDDANDDGKPFSIRTISNN